MFTQAGFEQEQLCVMAWNDEYVMYWSFTTASLSNLFGLSSIETNVLSVYHSSCCQPKLATLNNSESSHVREAQGENSQKKKPYPKVNPKY